MENSSRMVVPFAFLTGILLAAFLFMLTAGINYPSNAQAASSLISETTNQTDNNSTEKTNAITHLQGNCLVSSNFPARILQWCDLITYYANQRGLKPDLLAALILQESGGDPTAYSHSGAVGLMQVMPRDGLAAEFMCAGGPCFRNRPSIKQLQNPEFNIDYGTKMLANLINKYGSLSEALKYYGPMDVGYSYSNTVLALYKRLRE
jgi:soluble lytic murein transglycosylase-like protein